MDAIIACLFHLTLKLIYGTQETVAGNVNGHWTFENFNEFKFPSHVFILTQNILLLIVYLPCTTYAGPTKFMTLGAVNANSCSLLNSSFIYASKVYELNPIYLYQLKVRIIGRKRHGEWRKVLLDCECIHQYPHKLQCLSVCNKIPQYIETIEANPGMKKGGP